MWRSILWVSLWVAASCSGKTALPFEAEAELGTPFEVRVGEEVVVESTGMHLRFEGVLNDSRCPVDVECVSAGDARVRLMVGVGDPMEDRALELHTTEGLRSAVVAGYRITLDALEPRRRADKEIPRDAYRARIVVSAVE